ncbi:MAG: cyanoexosortase B system-associated protein [Cyanobacteria bacterium J06650_10]
MLTKKVARTSTTALIIIAILSLFIAVSALPRYFSSWPWSTPLKVANQSELQAIREKGIELPGWQTIDHLTTKLSGDTWSIQELSAMDESPFSESSPSTIALLLRPQVWEKDQPEVEWIDIKGVQRWQTDSRQSLSFNVDLPSAEEPSVSEDPLYNRQTIRITTDFFRAWSKEQTYAIMQWYASPTGGSPSPAWWFWSDQKMQWSARQRLPWVAVSLWLPIEPLSDITPHQALAVSLGQSVQTELLRTIFPETIAMHDSTSPDLASLNASLRRRISEAVWDVPFSDRFHSEPISSESHAFPIAA